MKNKALISIMLLAVSQQVYCLSLKDMLKEAAKQALEQPTTSSTAEPQQAVSEPQQVVSEPQQVVSDRRVTDDYGNGQQVVSEPQQAVSEPQHQQVKLCISNICVGDKLRDHDKVIDEEQYTIGITVEVAEERYATEKDSYDKVFSSCEKKRISELEKLKNLDNTLRADLKAKGVGVVESERVVRDVKNRLRVDEQIKYNSNPQPCIDSANKNKMKFLTAFNGEKNVTKEFLKSWAFLNENDAKEISNTQPALLSESNNYFGNGKLLGGRLVIDPKTNLGNFYAFEKLPVICQPVVTRGTMNNGDISFIALQEQESRNFIIIHLETEFHNISTVEAESLAKQYKNKFSQYYKISDRDSPEYFAYNSTLSPSVWFWYSVHGKSFYVKLTHPLFRGVPHENNAMPNYLKNQFLSITPYSMFSSAAAYSRIGFNTGRNFYEDYLKPSKCGSILNTDIQIK